MKPGSTRQRLAKMLNRCLPEYAGIPIVWKPEAMYPCRGFWRIRRVQMDVMSWEATAYRRDKPDRPVWVGGCWETMTECLKAGAVHFYGQRMDTIGPGEDK